jgi:SSS family solute:Na+ symporter
MLASVHYGIGFILGTGEKAHILGAAGSLYAVSCGLGLVALALLAGFYWQKREPLWTLLGHRYGRGTRRLVLFLSWAWMVGVVASQLLGGAYIVTTLRFNPSAVLLLLALVIMLASSLPVERAARLFQVLIGGSSLALLYALTLVGGPQEYVQSVLDFGPALCDVGWSEVISTVVATVLITLLGMDFHQFVVQTRSVREARLASVLAGIGLLLLAFLPSSVVIGASRLGVIPATIDGKQTVPAVLLWVGQKTSGLSHKFLG